MSESGWRCGAMGKVGFDPAELAVNNGVGADGMVTVVVAAMGFIRALDRVPGFFGGPKGADMADGINVDAISSCVEAIWADEESLGAWGISQKGQ